MKNTILLLAALSALHPFPRIGLAAPTVVSVSPLLQSRSASRSTEITIVFDMPMDPVTINAANIKIFGQWSGVANGQFSLQNNNTQVRFAPSTLFSAGEVVTVSLSRSVKSQSGENLARGYAWNFWIRTSPGTLNLTEVSRISARRAGEPHIQTYGAHGADLNHDGYSDFFAPNEISNDCRVFLNNGSGGFSGFTVFPIPNGSRPSTNESADFNNDGNLDLAVGNSAGDTVTVFLGNGAGGFLSIRNYQAASGVRGLAVADLDGDGDMDIVTANRAASNVAILLNNGDGTFGPRTVLEANGSAETACVVADANHDGIMDLFVGAYSSSEIILLLGNGTGGFTFSSKVAAGGNAPWKIAAGDLNGDGHVDVVSANANSGNCSVIFGNGLGGLSVATSYPTGSFPLSIVLGDLDGDGDLDLVTSNYTGANWTLYENNGAGVFINRRNIPSSQAGSCATLHDRDNDGDLDMTGIDEEADLVFLFENRPPAAVAEPPLPAGDFALLQSYPNPFNPGTRIRFQVPVAAHVSLSLSTVLGEKVATLFDDNTFGGHHEVWWDGTSSTGQSLAGGIYFCTMVATPDQRPRITRTIKLLLTR